MKRALCMLAAVLAIGAAPPRPSLAAEDQKTILLNRGFTLADADGRTVTLTDFPGKWLLVYFGYTHCADQCPTALTTMVEALDQLGPAAALVQPLFITVDPERDRGPMLRAFTAGLDERLVGLTGSPEQIAAAARMLGVSYERVLAGSDDYVIDHSTALALIEPSRHVAVTFAFAEPYRIAATIFALLERAGAPLAGVNNLGAYR